MVARMLIKGEVKDTQNDINKMDETSKEMKVKGDWP